MGYRKRRKVDVVLLVIGGLIAGLGALVAAAAGDSERVTGYWAWAHISSSSDAAGVHEVIDYDFGPQQRHGIFRDVPGLSSSSSVAVESATAPGQFRVERGNGPGVSRIRVGDPFSTISGRHRYELRFDVDTATASGELSWNAVGTDWNVGISEVELHLTADVELLDPFCSVGGFGAWGGCIAEQVAPGHLRVVVDRLDSFEGVTVSAEPGSPVSPPTPPTAPTGSVTDPGVGFVAIFLWSTVVALVIAAVVSRMIRRRGHEEVWVGGAADAAFGPNWGGAHETRFVDHEELAELASTEFVPPDDIAAWQGGVIHVEKSTAHHRVAWLLERAIDGAVRIEGTDKKDLTLHLVGGSPNDPRPVDPLLSGLFGNDRTIDLSEYDSQFSSGWNRVGEHIDHWHDGSALWDPAGDARRRRARVIGALAGLLGVAMLIGFGQAAGRTAMPWTVGALAGAAVFGAAWALMIRSWELRVRTPHGSGVWILLESFRRFIHHSDAQHVEAAAARGQLREYTAWAVALGEAERWADAVRATGHDVVDPATLAFATAGPTLASATATASTKPSSSSGGGGGSVGGGFGGGGGGSW